MGCNLEGAGSSQKRRERKPSKWWRHRMRQWVEWEEGEEQTNVTLIRTENIQVFRTQNAYHNCMQHMTHVKRLKPHP